MHRFCIAMLHLIKKFFFPEQNYFKKDERCSNIFYVAKYCEYYKNTIIVNCFIVFVKILDNEKMYEKKKNVDRSNVQMRA